MLAMGSVLALSSRHLRVCLCLSGCLPRPCQHYEPSDVLQTALIHLLRAYSFRLGPGQVPLKTATTALAMPTEGVKLYVVAR